MVEEARAGLLPVSVLVVDGVARIAEDASLGEVAQALADENVGLLVVGTGDDVAGVISERDVVRAVAEGRDLAATCACDIAQTDLAWCDWTVTVAEVAAEMVERYVRHVLVEEGGRLAGVVSVRDLLAAYAAADNQET